MSNSSVKFSPLSDSNGLARRVESALVGDSGAAATHSPLVHSIIAGYAAGLCGVTVGHPMDSLKVFLQTDSSRGGNAVSFGFTNNSISSSSSSSSSASPSTSAQQNRTMSSTREFSIPKKKINLRTLYAGVGAPLITVGLIQSANFGIYDSVRRILHSSQAPDAAPSDYMSHDPIINVALSSMVAGGILAFVTSPLLIIKTKQQVMTWNVGVALHDTLKPRAGRSSFLPNLFVGFGPHISSEMLGRGVYFASYETMKRKLARDSNLETASLGQRMVAASLSGILCWSVIFPLDVLRNRLYANSVVYEESCSAWSLAKQLYREDKLRPFYRGFGVTVLRAGPVAAAVLPVYDTTLEWLNNNWRGEGDK